MGKKRIYIIITILLLVLTTIGTLENSYSAPQAGKVCSQMGSFMKRQKVNVGGLIKPDEPNRKWTVEEVFNKSVNFTSYYGEGEGDWIFANKVDRGEARANLKGYDWSDATVQDNIKSLRNMGCIVSMGDGFPNLGLSMASGISGLISTSIGALIGRDFMVAGLVDIIGGTDSNDGLIAIFFKSIYMPLVVIAFLFTAATILYKGLIKRQLREALNSIIWSTLAFVIGVTLMFIPSFLVGIPQAVTSTITTCVLGAINGQNCLTGDVTNSALLTGVECSSRIEGDSNSADMMVNGMSCTIWKTFVLEPWAEEQFGAPYNELYTSNPPEGALMWNGLDGGNGQQYCVNLASSQSASSFNHGSVVMDRNDDSTVCNIALYQLYLMTEMEDTKNHSGDGYILTSDVENISYDERWYDIILPMAKHSTGWKNWNGQSRLLNRIGTSSMSLIAVIAAATVLIVLSVFGAAYKLIGIIMMAFAPLFLLFAVEPNRGKKIFLGWLETLISSMLKYFAVTILIVVSLVLYAGVLSTTTGATSFIAVIILTAVLLTYREEVVNLIGASNMGGQRLTNKANKALDWTKKQGKEKGSAIVGGAIGGSAAGRLSHREDIKKRQSSVDDLKNQLEAATKENRVEDVDKLSKALKSEEGQLKEAKSVPARVVSRGKGTIEGSSDALNRSLRRGTSLTATAFRQKSMTKSELDRQYADLRGRGAAKDPEVVGSTGTNENIPPKDPGPDNTPGNDNLKRDTKLNDLDLTKTTLEDQRDELEYVGDLTEDEKVELSDFVDKLIGEEDDSELANMANNPEIMADENKRMAVANEINARLRFNTLTGVVSNPALAMSAMANTANMSAVDLELAMNVSAENYKEFGDEAELSRFRDLSQERLDRNIIDEATYNEKEKLLLAGRESLMQDGNEYYKQEGIKSREELEQLFKNDREEYDKYINERNVLGVAGASNVSKGLIEREHYIANMRAENTEQKLPDLKDIDTKSPDEEVERQGVNTNKNEELKNSVNKDNIEDVNKDKNEQKLPDLNDTKTEDSNVETERQNIAPNKDLKGIIKEEKGDELKQDIDVETSDINKTSETPTERNIIIPPTIKDKQTSNEQTSEDIGQTVTQENMNNKTSNINESYSIKDTAAKDIEQPDDLNLINDTKQNTTDNIVDHKFVTPKNFNDNSKFTGETNSSQSSNDSKVKYVETETVNKDNDSLAKEVDRQVDKGESSHKPNIEEPTQRPDTNKQEVKQEPTQRPETTRQEVKQEPTQRPDTNKQEVKQEPVQRPDTNKQEVKQEPAQRPDTNKQEVKQEPTQRPETNNQEIKQEPVQRPETNKQEVKQEPAQRPDTNKQEVKQEPTQRPETNNQEIKQEPTQRSDTRKQEVKQEPVQRPEVNNKEVKQEQTQKPETNKKDVKQQVDDNKKEIEVQSPGRRTDENNKPEHKKEVIKRDVVNSTTTDKTSHDVVNKENKVDKSEDKITSQSSIPDKIDWDSEFEQEEINNLNVDKDKQEVDIDLDSFYDNIDDFMKD